MPWDFPKRGNNQQDWIKDPRNLNAHAFVLSPSRWGLALNTTSKAQSWPCSQFVEPSTPSTSREAAHSWRQSWALPFFVPSFFSTLLGPVPVHKSMSSHVPSAKDFLTWGICPALPRHCSTGCPYGVRGCRSASGFCITWWMNAYVDEWVSCAARSDVRTYPIPCKSHTGS